MALQARNPRLQVAVTMSDPQGEPWPGLVGRIDKALLTKLVPGLPASRVHLCGPPAMMDAVKSALIGLGVPEGQCRKGGRSPYCARYRAQPRFRKNPCRINHFLHHITFVVTYILMAQQLSPRWNKMRITIDHANALGYRDRCYGCDADTRRETLSRFEGRPNVTPAPTGAASTRLITMWKTTIDGARDRAVAEPAMQHACNTLEKAHLDQWLRRLPQIRNLQHMADYRPRGLGSGSVWPWLVFRPEARSHHRSSCPEGSFRCESRRDARCRLPRW